LLALTVNSRGPDVALTRRKKAKFLADQPTSDAATFGFQISSHNLRRGANLESVCICPRHTVLDIFALAYRQSTDKKSIQAIR
jgi:hypothetical protein